MFCSPKFVNFENEHTEELTNSLSTADPCLKQGFQQHSRSYQSTLAMVAKRLHTNNREENINQREMTSGL